MLWFGGVLEVGSTQMLHNLENYILTILNISLCARDGSGAAIVVYSSTKHNRGLVAI